ncbi:MAG: hypothetical protein ACJ74W_07495 [Pyrinomonadaceae bacterium]
MRRVSVAAVLTVIITPVLQGQQSNSRNALDRVLSKRGREFNDRVMDRELHRPANPEEERLALAQIKEDYVRIQVVNHDLAQATAHAAGALDLKAVAKCAAEIKKRAGRLKYNLVLPKPGAVANGPEPTGTEIEQLQSALSTLSDLIVGFVNNPLFKEVNVVDVQSSFKARRDLEQIIALSEHVKKSSEKLDKAAQKSQ